MSKVIVSIVAWNSMKYLPEALASVSRQTHPDISVVVVDNASSDGSAEFVRREYPKATVIRNAKNLGFARAHNQAIAHAAAHLKSDGDAFMLVMNPDVIMEPDYLKELVAHVERRPEVGSATGKIFRMRRTGEDVLAEGEKTDVFDTTGMVVYRSRRTTERGGGERDDVSPEALAKGDGGIYAKTEEVFGVSGALALYRMSALEDVAYGDEFFDDDFFAYKEDVDLAWRLRLAGWQALYVPHAVAYHYRTAAGGGESNLKTLRNRLRKPKIVNFLSYRNHFLLLVKNDQFFNALLALPWIFWYELRKAGIVLLLETRSLAAVPSAFRLLPRMLAKRRRTFSRARTKAREIRKWFV